MALPGAHGIMSVVGVCMLGAGLIVYGVGLGTPEWDVIYNSELKTEKVATAGIWQICEKGFCKPTQMKGTALMSCEASSVIAMLMAAVSFACGLCSMGLIITNKGINVTFPLVSLFCALVAAAGVFKVMLVWDVYIHHFHIHNVIDSKPFRNKTDFGYSFLLSLVGGILIAFGGIFVYAGSRRTPQQPYTRTY